MLEVGDRVAGGALVWTTPQETATVRELLSEGPILLVFYLFDWSST